MNRLLLCLLLVLMPVPACADDGASMRFLRKADAAFTAHQIRIARVELMNATDADPRNVLAWLYRAKVALALGRGIEADNALDDAIRAGARETATYHYRAHALLLEGKPEAALKMAEASRIPWPWRGYAARMRGRALAELGDFRGAQGEFDAALALAPRSPALWEDIARARLLAADRAGAIEAARRAAAYDPRRVSALVFNGVLVRAQYGLRAALPWFDRALAIDSLDIDALLERAATLGELGRYRAMLETTRKVLANDPGNARAYYLQAVLAARARNFKLAGALIDLADDSLGDEPGLLLLKGIVALTDNVPQRAQDALGTLVEMQPANARARRLLALAQWQGGDPEAVLATLRPLDDHYALTLSARALEALGDRAAAADYLDRAAFYRRSGWPVEEPGTPVGEAAARSAQARALLASGRNGEAIQLALGLSRAHPGVTDSHRLAGDVLLASGQFDAAAEAYRRAANLVFSESTALGMAEALHGAGRDRAAATVLGVYLRQNPRSLRARLGWAGLRMSAGRWAEAAAILDDVQRRIGYRDVLVTTNLAWCRFNAGEKDEGVRLARDAYALAPAKAAVSHALGWMLFETGEDRDTARALLRQAAAQAPDWPLAQLHLRRALAESGRPG